MKKNNNTLKIFFIKLISIVVAILIIINVSYNLIINNIINLNNFSKISTKENLDKFKNKIRNEINKSLQKEKILNDDDKKIIIELYNKIKDELKK